MPEVVDALSRTVALTRPAKRVVSLVPSLTEAVATFSEGSLIGCTKFCVEPTAVVDGLRKFGGTKDPDVAAIVAQEPDLVIANKEENRREDVDALTAAGLTVFVGHALTVSQAIDELESIRTLLGAVSATRIIQTLRAEVEQQESLNEERPRVTAFCPIWRNPYMAVSGATYAGDLLRLAGAINVFEDHPSEARYPQVGIAEIEAADPTIVLLPSEPFHFRERHREELMALRSVAAVKTGNVHLIDGRHLTWYGPRIGEGLRAVVKLLDHARPDWTPPVDESRESETAQGQSKPPTPSTAPPGGKPRRAPDPNVSLPPGLRLDVTQQDTVDEGS